MKTPRLAGLLLCLLVAVSGCGPAAGTHATPTVDAAKEASKTRERYKQYATCMRAQGVTISDDPEDSSAVTAPTMEQLQAAYEACRKYAVNPEAAPTQLAEELEFRRKVAKCMRDNGFGEWPDPDPNVPWISMPPGVDPDQANAMMTTCARKIGQ